MQCVSTAGQKIAARSTWIWRRWLAKSKLVSRYMAPALWLHTCREWQVETQDIPVSGCMLSHGLTLLTTINTELIRRSTTKLQRESWRRSGHKRPKLLGNKNGVKWLGAVILYILGTLCLILSQWSIESWENVVLAQLWYLLADVCCYARQYLPSDNWDWLWKSIDWVPGAYYILIKHRDLAVYIGKFYVRHEMKSTRW